jgi:MFS superfamily sulfate permease-like transporter
VVGQFHVLFDARPLSSGPENLAAMPARLLGLSFGSMEATELAFLVGVTSILAMLGWEKLRPAALRLVPGALIGVLAGTALAAGLGLAVTRVAVPASITGAIAPAGGWSILASPAVLLTAVALAFIASAETLLSAAAVDRMHEGVRTDYNKELRAQGIGNLLCGFAGALPMTGVIVRSSANVQAGAATRLSAILHGAWILLFVAALPFVLTRIPMAALGAILVVTGWRLVGVAHVRHLFRHHGLLPALTWAATLVTVVAVDLLTGVLVGIALSLLELVPHRAALGLKVREDAHGEGRSIALNGTATLLSLPRLSDALERVPPGAPVRIDATELKGVDHSSAEMLRDWFARRRRAGAAVELADPGNRLGALAG